MFQTLIMKLSHSDPRPVENRISQTTVINFMLVAGVILVVVAFFWMNPRVGEITVATPNGPSVTVKVAESNEISELIRKGLENARTAGFLANSLLSIIEKLPSGSELGEKLLELAEQRRSPFFSTSVPVKLVHGPEVPPRLAGVCEKSQFAGKNIVVFFLGSEGELLDTVHAYADVKMMFPCPEGAETVRLNSGNVLKLERADKVMAKRTF